MSRNPTAIVWEEQEQARIVALNVIGRYATLTIEMVVGLLMLPFNANHLGAREYGLWMLAASIVSYFPVLDLGLGNAMERAVAQYRAQRDPEAINEVASTLVFVFAGTGLIAMLVVTGVAWNIGHIFDLAPAQVPTGRILMMMIGAQVAIGLPFTIYGGVVNGFQRTYLNALVGGCVSLSVATVNIIVLWTGGGLVELVGLMTATRLLGYVVYRLNAYRVFPLLRIRLSLFRRARLRELTGFGAWMMVQAASVKVNYASDAVVIGAFLTTGSVAVWTIAQRLADAVLQVTNQLNYVLFPIVVGADTSRRNDRLAEVLVQGTRLSLATILPVAGSLRTPRRFGSAGMDAWAALCRRCGDRARSSRWSCWSASEAGRRAPSCSERERIGWSPSRTSSRRQSTLDSASCSFVGGVCQALPSPR